jgi:hypothetical protein
VKRDAAEQPQHLVGVDRGGVERRREDQRSGAQREDAAVRGRLERDVGVAKQRQIAEPDDHRQPVARDERVDDNDHDPERHRQPRGAPQLASCSRGEAGRGRRKHDCPEHDRVVEHQCRECERQAVRTSGGGAGRVQRARAPAVDHGTGTG